MEYAKKYEVYDAERFYGIFIEILEFGCEA